MIIRGQRLALFFLAALLAGISLSLAAQSSLEERWEKEANALQPPQEVMDRIGIKPGMVIGEIGAGYGRYTVHLAGRVGDRGKIFANDISTKALAYLAERCRKNQITNVQTVLGQSDDPLFPASGLDMIFMVWTYHMMEKPVAMLKSIVRYLKPGASLVMIEPIPSDTEKEIQEMTARTGKTPNDIHIVSRESLTRDAEEAGFELVKVDSFLKSDTIFVLRVKTARTS